MIQSEPIMIDYAVLSIQGRQYKVLPEKPFTVNFVAGDAKTLDVDVLMISKDGKVDFGAPFLKEKLKLDVISQERGPKIRVATYKAKANTRRVKGSKSFLTKLQLSTEKREKKA